MGGCCAAPKEGSKPGIEIQPKGGILKKKNAAESDNDDKKKSSQESGQKDENTPENEKTPEKEGDPSNMPNLEAGLQDDDKLALEKDKKDNIEKCEPDQISVTNVDKPPEELEEQTTPLVLAVEQLEEEKEDVTRMVSFFGDRSRLRENDYGYTETQLTRMNDASQVFDEDQIEERYRKIDIRMEGGQESSGEYQVVFDALNEEYSDQVENLFGIKKPYQFISRNHSRKNSAGESQMTNENNAFFSSKTEQAHFFQQLQHVSGQFEPDLFGENKILDQEQEVINFQLVSSNENSLDNISEHQETENSQMQLKYDVHAFQSTTKQMKQSVFSDDNFIAKI